MSDRQVLCKGWEPGDQLHVAVEEASFTMYALVCGAKKYPLLQALLPARPSDAADCLECQGTGWFMKNLGCGECWSLGWLHESVNDAPPPKPPLPSLASKLRAWFVKERRW